MQNILIGVKRFFKNKNTVTIIGVLVCLGVLYFVYDWRIEEATNPVSVAYAKVTIGPRTLITSDMVSTKKVPGELVSNIYRNPSDVVGKYVKSNAVIPINGLFYEDYIGNWDSVSNPIHSDIESGHTLFSLEVDSNSTYGNSIYPGNYIDLYFQYRESGGGKLTIGKFIESIKVLAVTDSNGRNVFETAGTPGTPKYLIFSVDEEHYLLLKRTLLIYGDNALFPVPRNKDYSNNPTDTKVVNTVIEKMVNDKTYEIPEELLK